MRPLAEVAPTPEQLIIVSRNRPGIEVIRGAAGSGKTTTALLRLRTIIGVFVSRKGRLKTSQPVRILVLTYNRTLSGYIKALARQQVVETKEIDLQISTFAKWAMNNVGMPKIVTPTSVRAKIAEFGKGIGLETRFLVEEADYILGRFEHDKFENYLTASRVGRGVSPRVERATREAILNRVVNPYQAWKKDIGRLDWNDLAFKAATSKICEPYDIVIADETQDFSANEIRAVRNHVADVHSLTFIVDSAQRIYARGFTWRECGITVRPENTHRLQKNYRNTIEIAQFAAGIVEGMVIDDDATMPDFTKSTRHGPKPVVMRGTFTNQLVHVVEFISNLDLNSESVAILHPLGGGWFKAVRETLGRNKLAFVEISRESEWPDGDENIALSTIPSAKGLEFDHVVMIGLNAELFEHGSDEEDDRLTRLRRSVAMAVGRARKSVIIGYKKSDEPALVRYMKASTFRLIDV